jgi:hypothetical protein
LIIRLQVADLSISTSSQPLSTTAQTLHLSSYKISQSQFKMAHLILSGATGLVGSAALAHMLTLTGPGGPISRLSILSRSAVPMADGNEKVKVIKVTDFGSYPAEVLNQLKGAEGCVWALGISQTQVSKE